MRAGSTPDSNLRPVSGGTVDVPHRFPTSQRSASRINGLTDMINRAGRECPRLKLVRVGGQSSTTIRRRSWAGVRRVRAPRQFKRPEAGVVEFSCGDGQGKRPLRPLSHSIGLSGRRCQSSRLAQGSVPITVRSSSWWWRVERGGWVVTLVAAALTALLTGMCDSGGHHHPARVMSERSTSAAANTSEPSVNCPDRNGAHCAPAPEQHVATEVEERRPLGALAADSAQCRTTFPPVTDASNPSRRGPPATTGQDVLRRGCVSRR